MVLVSPLPSLPSVLGVVQALNAKTALTSITTTRRKDKIFLDMVGVPPNKNKMNIYLQGQAL
jgi:hypothetical protein